MHVVYERCCGLDIHKTSVVACLLLTERDGRVRKEVRTFGTMTADLLALADWLLAAGCTHVALESTGVYWRPIRNLLEGSFTLPVVNPRHIKAVPGRKTDVRDSEWIADMLQHGLLRPSFVPPRPQWELRELTRYRTSLLREVLRLAQGQPPPLREPPHGGCPLLVQRTAPGRTVALQRRQPRPGVQSGQRGAVGRLELQEHLVELVPQAGRFGERAVPLGDQQVQDRRLILGEHARQGGRFAPDQQRHRGGVERVALAWLASAAPSLRRPAGVHLVDGLPGAYQILS
jgi:hypothetical protein